MSVAADDSDCKIDPAGRGIAANGVVDITAEPDGVAAPHVTESDIEDFFNNAKDAASSEGLHPSAIALTEAADEAANSPSSVKDIVEAGDGDGCNKAVIGDEDASELSDPVGSGEANQEVNIDEADDDAEGAGDEYDEEHDEEEDVSGGSDSGSEYAPEVTTKTTRRSTRTRAQRKLVSQKPQMLQEPEGQEEPGEQVEETTKSEKTAANRRGGKRGKRDKHELEPSEEPQEDAEQHADADEPMQESQPEEKPAKRRGGRKRAQPVKEDSTALPEEKKTAKRSRKRKAEKQECDHEDQKPVVDEDGGVNPRKRSRRAKEKPDLDCDAEPGAEEENKSTKRARASRSNKLKLDVQPKMEHAEPANGRRAKSEPLPGAEAELSPDLKTGKSHKTPKSSGRPAARWSPEDRTALYLAAVEANCGGKVRTERFQAGVAGRNAKQCFDAWQKTAEPFIMKYLSEEPKPVPKDWRAEPTGRKGWDGAALQALFDAAIGTETPRFTEGINGRSKATTRDTWK